MLQFLQHTNEIVLISTELLNSSIIFLITLSGLWSISKNYLFKKSKI